MEFQQNFSSNELQTQCGYIALLGQPNAGKSTLLNACIGQKLAGVSRKPQTTRNKILGIAVEASAQLIFVDTPGLHKVQNQIKLNKLMNKEAWSALADVNLVCYLIDSTVGWSQEDEPLLIKILTNAQVPVLILLSKTDRLKKSDVKLQQQALRLKLTELLTNPALAEIKNHLHPLSPLPLSAKIKEEVQNLKSLVQKELPEAPWLYPADDLTDRPQKFIFTELIREQIFRTFSQEIPYQCGVFIDKVTEEPKVTKILASIIVNRMSHKPILIGKDGAALKEIGRAAREAIERNLDKKVYLQLHVEVDPNWVDKDELLSRYQNL